MKRKHYILSLLALLASINAFAAVTIGNFGYEFSGDEATVTWVGATRSIDIPSTVTYDGKTYTVTRIANGAFNSTSSSLYYTSISFPETLTYIEGGTLDRTTWYRNQPDGLVYAGKVAYKYKGTMPSDTHIDISEGTLGIAGEAFYGFSGLTSVTIPNSVKVIGIRAFYNCSDLTDITFPNGATKIMAVAFYGTAWYNNQPDGLVYAGKVAYMYKGTAPEGTHITIKQGTLAIAEYAFRDCGMTSITIPNSMVSIGEYAFLRCGLTSVTIPNSVTNIGASAFEQSGLTSVTIGSGVKSVGDKAFYNCNRLTAVHITDLAAWCNISFGINGSQPLYYAHHLYLNGEEIKDLVIPDGVSSIGFQAFDSCSGLTSVSIPNSVTSIGVSAFWSCTGLTSITIPNSVTSIGSNAFSGCSGLTSVTIGKSVTSIGDYAFNSCNSLTDIYCYADSVPATGTNTFTNYTAKLHVPIGSVVTYRTTEPWSGFRSNTEGYFITFADDNVKAICVAKWDTDGDGVLNINEAAAVTNLSTYFKSNKQITSFDELKYFTGLTTIGNHAFYGCDAMTSIIIPENLTSIGERAFYGCSGLESINIPNSMTTIDNYAFVECSSLTAVYITDLSAWCNISFGNTTSQPLSYAPHLYLNDVEVTKLNIPSGITQINDYAFKGFTSLTSVVFSSSVLSIGKSAFNGCDGLTDVYIPSSVTSIDSYAFYKCSALTDVYCYTEIVPNTNTNAFSASNYKAATLHVLDVAEEAFRTTLPWKDFGTIEVISPYISFADQTVKDICIANWDINCDGEMTLEEAAAVTDLGEVFKGKSISSFDELHYFTGLTSISDNAFRGCSRLTSITIPNGVTNIGLYAFQDCSGLTSITIPNGVTYIGKYTFKGCSGLTSVNIPDNVNGIGSQAFDKCSGLTSITIPKNVTSIDSYAFSGCMLRSVLIKCSTPPTLSSSDIKSPVTFSQATCNHATLYVPIGAWDTYAFADGWYWFINIRETALEEEQVSEQQAYTLMDAGTFAYSVYDPVNDCIGTINSAGNIDENNPNHSWQMIEADGMHYLYNIGAKKFVKRNGNSLALTDNPEPIDVANGTDGIVLAEQADRQWALVSNESLSVSQSAIEDIITGVQVLSDSPLKDEDIYNLSGQRLQKMQHGINIVGGKKVIVK